MAFNRKQNLRPLRRNMHFITEGEATERAYLTIVWKQLKLRERYTPRFHHRHPDIPSLINMALKVEENRKFSTKQGDEIWIILDHDEKSHVAEQFQKLGEWEKAYPHRHVAISSPRFEYWLLWHVEENPRKAHSLSDDYVQSRIPNFKNLPPGTTVITEVGIRAAMNRANASPAPCCVNPGVLGSGLGHLIERLLSE